MAFDETELFLCSWGDIQLFVSSIEWDAGETQVIHDLASGDFHPVQPRGSRIRRATAQLMFDDFDGAHETGITAFRRFEVTTKERRIFTHPIDGSFFARIGELKPMMDENSVIRASCEFIPDAVVPPVAPTGAGTSGTSGEESVAAASDSLAQRLSELRLGFHPVQARSLDFTKPISVSVDAAFSVKTDPSASVSSNISVSVARGDISATPTRTSNATSADSGALAFANMYGNALAAAQTGSSAQVSGMASASAFAFAMASAALDADVRHSVASWTDEDVPIRKISIDATRLSDGIATMIEVGGFELDLQLWPAFRAAILLGESVRNAVISATSETPTVFVIRVQRSTALLSLAAKIYGGADAAARARQIVSLNDISTPGWLDPGDYLMPTRPVQANSALLDEPES